MDMIEQVARAILASHDWTDENVRTGWDGLSADWQDCYRAMAKGAIEAMRGPTEAMILAGGPAFDANVYMGEATDRAKEKAAANWSVMIDAALKDT